MRGQSITDPVGKLDLDMILENLSQIKYKNYFSQYKNAFLHFCEWQNIKLSDNTLNAIEELEKGTRRKNRKLETIQFKEVESKINNLRNKKLKLCYQVLLATGLRVSELASINTSDIIATNDYITFSFVAKGGKSQTSTINALEYPIAYKNVKKLIENKPDGKLFYSTVYLQKNAKKLGFKCHDLRRACAKLEYRKTKSKEAVKTKLRHSSVKTSNIYIKSKIKF